MDWDYAYAIPQLLFATPTVVTLVIGIVLIAVRRDRLGPRSRGLGIAGCAVLLVDGLVNTAYTVALPQLLRERSISDLNLVIGVSGLFFVILNCAGLALLVAALVTAAGGRPAPPPPAPWGPPHAAYRAPEG